MAGHAEADRGQHELALLQRQHLAADRPRHIGHVDDADDEDRQPQAAGADGDRADVEPWLISTIESEIASR